MLLYKKWAIFLDHSVIEFVLQFSAHNFVFLLSVERLFFSWCTQAFEKLVKFEISTMFFWKLRLVLSCFLFNFLQNICSNYFILWASPYPLLGCIRSCGRSWAAIWLSHHPEPICFAISAHVFRFVPSIEPACCHGSSSSMVGSTQV